MSTELKRLVSPQDIYALTTLGLNTNAHALTVSVPLVERQRLRPVLGYDLFSELLNFVQQETTDTEDPLAELAAEVKPMLSEWVVYEAWPQLVVHETNAGIVVTTGKSEGTATADKELVADSRESHQGRAQFYTQDLQAWLLRHAARFPAFSPPPGEAKSTMPLGGLHFS